ncbi:hypothetical protein K438DRAFT_860289 [Mycena galopus ATCC 62051]|nr:hypothetical protein K438DRAFT_860289 [Mycena galopus ATCC 62051]
MFRSLPRTLRWHNICACRGLRILWGCHGPLSSFMKTSAGHRSQPGRIERNCTVKPLRMNSEIYEQPALHCVDCNKIHSPRTALNPSPFRSFTAQERIPDASETAAIREFVQHTDAEIVWREVAIDRLLCEVAELGRRSEQHKSIMAPIRRVPPEIMAEIFLQLTSMEARAARASYPFDLVEGTNFFEKNDKVRPVLHRAPLILGEVSRRWRAIALSTPRLWNSIFLYCMDAKLQDNISLCNMWLKRSGSLPLSIRFYRAYGQDPTTPQKTVDHCQDFFRVILPYAQRWRLLDLDNVPVASCNILYDNLPDSLPMLETLSIDHDFPADSFSTP